MADRPWFLRGQAGEQRAQAEKELSDEKALANKRFWMKAGEEVKDVVFLDDDGFFFYEHTFQVGQKWYNATCVKDIPTMAPCPICRTFGEETSSYVGVYTVIDPRRWESQDKSKVYENQPKLFVAKTKVMEQLRVLKPKVGGLVGAMFDIGRLGDQAPRTGNNFFPKGKLTPQELATKYPGVKPFDYIKIFEPKSAEEMLRMYGAKVSAPVGSPADLKQGAPATTPAANLAPVPEEVL